MPDNRVDSILLEIEATTDKADGGIDKVTKALASMKKITEGLDTEKLKQILDVMRGFSGVGDDLKNAGSGMRSIASSIKSLSGVDTAKLKEVAATVKEVSTALGNLGSNNRVSIRIDSEGAQRRVQPLENGQQATAATESVATASEEAQAAMNGAASAASQLAQEESNLGTAGQSAAAGQTNLNESLNQANTNPANRRIQELIDQINKYKATVSGMESGKIRFDTGQYEEAVNGLRQAQEQFKQFKETVSQSPKNMEDVAKSIKSIGDAAQKCGLGTFSSILSGIASILPAIETGGMAANAGFQSMAVGLEAVQAAIPIIGIILTILTAIINAVRQVANAVKNETQKIISAVKTVVNKIRSGIAAIINKFKELKKRVRESLGFSEKQSGAFAKKLGSIIRLGTFMLLRSMFTHLFELVKTGFDNLVIYSKRAGTEFHKNVNLLYNDLRQLGASLTTAFEPILNVVTPILDYLIQKLVAATNALAQFFSALTGKKFYTKAIKQNKDYTDSLNGAAKAAKNLTTGIDELNILSDDKSGSGSNSGVDGSGYETDEIADKYKNLAQMIKDAWDEADFYDVGRMFGEKLKEALDNIQWDGIKASLRKIAKCIATFLNEVDWYELLKGVGTAMSEIDWDTILKTVFKVFAAKWTFKNMFKWVSWTAIWNELKTSVVEGISKKFGIGSDDGEINTVGEKIVSGLLGGISKSLLPAPLQTALSCFGNVTDVVKGIFGIGGSSDSTVFSTLGSNLVTAFNGGIGKKFSDCQAKVTEWAGKVNDWFSGTSFGKICKETWETHGQNIITGFKDKIGNAYTTTKDNITTWAAKAKEWFNNSSFGGVNMETWTGYANDIISGFKTKVGNAYTQTKDNITTWASKAKEWFNSSSFGGVNNGTWTTYANDIITGFKTKVGNTYTTTKDNITTWASKVKEWYTSSGFGNINSNTWQTYANNIISGFREKVGNTYTTTKNNITTWASSLKDWFSGSSFGNINNATWTTYAGNIITGFRNKIGLSYTDTKSNITTWASNLKTWFSDNGFGGINSSKWSTYAENIISGFKTKIGNSYTTCKSNIETWASNVKTWFTNTCSYDKWYDIAKNVVDGFKNGIGNLYSTCKNNIESWGSSIISWFKDKLDINSPSRVFKQLGAYSVEGYNIGVEKEGEKTKGIVTSWADSFTDMDVNLGTRLKINDSALKEYSNNYGSDFTNEAIVQRVTREVSTNGTVQATLNSGGGLKEAIKEALDDLGITTAVSEISKNTKTQADKKEQTIVEIGGKTVTDAVTTQRNANGYSFQGA